MSTTLRGVFFGAIIGLLLGVIIYALPGSYLFVGRDYQGYLPYVGIPTEYIRTALWHFLAVGGTTGCLLGAFISYTGRYSAMPTYIVWNTGMSLAFLCPLIVYFHLWHQLETMTGTQGMVSMIAAICGWPVALIAAGTTDYIDGRLVTWRSTRWEQRRAKHRNV